MNLEFLKKSFRRPETGDIFAMSMRGVFLYGRVIATDAKIGPMQGCILIYIYRDRSSTKLPAPRLSPMNLLLPPVLTNTLAWRRGYFETILHEPLTEHDRLKQHCFMSLVTREFFDENNNKLERACESAGVWGLDSFRTIDDKVSRALGVPMSKD